jgi:hypothetical protein
MLAGIPGLRGPVDHHQRRAARRYAAPLVAVGADRFNVSLDSLHRERFAEITRRPARCRRAAERLADAGAEGFASCLCPRTVVRLRGIQPAAAHRRDIEVRGRHAFLLLMSPRDHGRILPGGRGSPPLPNQNQRFLLRSVPNKVSHRAPVAAVHSYRLTD